MNLELYIDPAPGDGPISTPLFEIGGEYARALRGLAGRHQILGRLPASIFLEIYSYEVLERMRDRMRQKPGSGAPWWMPFWPASLFDAAGVATHPALELQSMFPGFARTTLRLRHARDFEQAVQTWLGEQRLSVQDYEQSVLRYAESLGWEVIGP